MPPYRAGNLFVETFCRDMPSGIHVTQADYFAYVVGVAVIVLPVARIRELGPSLKEVSMNKGSHPTRGRLIPISDIPRLFP
jgi:hypothetical protein